MTDEEPNVERGGPLRRLKLVAFVLTGVSLALWVGGSVGARIGPFDTTVSVRPSLSGSTLVRLAPLGSIELDTHDAPVSLEVTVDELRLEEAERIANDPTVLRSLEDDIADDARAALWRVAFRCLVVAAIGGALGALIASARPLPVLVGALAGAVIALGVGGVAALTFDPDAVEEPSYSGLLTMAPTAVGDVEGVLGRAGEYRAQLTELVGNVVRLYRAADALPTFDPDGETVRVLHVSDIHNNPQAFDLIDLLVEQFAVDVVADTGDITDWGTAPESQLFDRISDIDVPYVWVRGNHDSVATQQAVASQSNAVVLDGTAEEIAGLRFWGAADVRYTPDRSSDASGDANGEVDPEAVADALEGSEPPDVDIAMVHDPAMAADLDGLVPLVLAGHAHEAEEQDIGDTRMLVEGSTGGAGLRGLQRDEPLALTCSVLYFDRTEGRLLAYDRITVRGLGGAGAVIERTVLADDEGG